MTFKNAKYLLYRFNDLLESTGQSIILIKRSKVTDDYIAAEEIQNQNWKYFIERVLEVCIAKDVGSTIKKSEVFLLTKVENITIAKKSYQTFYNIIERNLYSTMEKLPFFLRTDMPISPVDLYKKFAGTDAKALVSIHALAALNIHFGRNKYIPQGVLGEYLTNLTYQALSHENDKILMSFSEIGLLVNDLLEQFIFK